MICFETIFGIRRLTGTILEEGTKKGQLTLLQARELQRDLKKRWWHPKNIRIEVDDPWA